MSSYLQFANTSGATYISNTEYADYTLGFGDLSHNYDVNIVAMTSGVDADNGWDAKPGIITRYTDANNYLRTWFLCSGDPGTIGIDGIINGELSFRETMTATGRLFPNTQLSRASVILNSDKVTVLYNGVTQGTFDLNGSGSTLETDGQFGFTMVDNAQEPNSSFFLLNQAYVNNPRLTLFIEGSVVSEIDASGMLFNWIPENLEPRTGLPADATNWAASGTLDVPLDTFYSSERPEIYDTNVPLGTVRHAHFDGNNDIFEATLSSNEATALGSDDEGTVLIYATPLDLSSTNVWMGFFNTTQDSHWMQIECDPNGRLEMELKLQDSSNLHRVRSDNGVIASGNYYRLAFRQDATSGAFFLNGEKIPSTTADLGGGTSSDWLSTIIAETGVNDFIDRPVIGAKRTGGNAPGQDFTGFIDRVSYWSTALTDDQCISLTTQQEPRDSSQVFRFHSHDASGSIDDGSTAWVDTGVSGILHLADPEDTWFNYQLPTIRDATPPDSTFARYLECSGIAGNNASFFESDEYFDAAHIERMNNSGSGTFLFIAKMHDHITPIIQEISSTDIHDASLQSGIGLRLGVGPGNEPGWFHIRVLGSGTGGGQEIITHRFDQSGVYSDHDWHRYAVRQNGEQCHLFIDGGKYTSDNTLQDGTNVLGSGAWFSDIINTFQTPPEIRKLTIGAIRNDVNAPINEFNGDISYFSYYDRVLTDNECIIFTLPSGG